MKLNDLYDGLKDLLQRLGVDFKEENLKTAGLPVRSGLCRVRNRSLYIMNKHLDLARKVELLSDCIRTLPHEEIYVMPALRDFISGGRSRELRATEAGLSVAPEKPPV
jgi:hypothetical protein